VLYVQWYDRARKTWVPRSLGHRDRDQALQQARGLAGAILAANEAECRGELTVADLFGRFEREVTAHGDSRQGAEDRRRIAVWTAYLGGSRSADTIDRAALDQFARTRRAGSLTVPGVKLSQHPTDRTIGADLEFLRRVCNWAQTVTRGNGKPLLEHHALTRYAIPTNANPRRPVATYDRYLAIRAHADEVDRQLLFGAFLDLVEGLGWRVTAICELRASDVDLTATAARPHGRLRKRAETDKMGIAQWVPMSAPVRSAVLAALERNAAIGEAPLFPAPGRDGPWTRYHARDLLERGEKAARAAALKRDDADAAASLAPLEGSDFHAYRRAWATARKHLPLKDVASAGGWRSTDTLLRCYTQVDEATMFEVVSETRKVRAAGKQLEH
jgi:integrase